MEGGRVGSLGIWEAGGQMRLCCAALRWAEVVRAALVERPVLREQKSALALWASDGIYSCLD